MVFHFDIPRLKSDAKKAAKVSGRKLSDVQHELAASKGYTSWSSLVRSASDEESAQTLVAWFERKHDAVSDDPEAPGVAPGAILSAAGREEAEGYPEAVATLEARGPWRRKGATAAGRPATDADLEEVLRWTEEDDAAGHAGFFCNRSIIAERHDEGMLHVLADPVTDMPVAYLADGEYGPYLLQVKADVRHKGHGTTLANYMIDLWRQKQDASYLYLQCEPPESAEFWKRMGFTIYERTISVETQTRAFIKLPRYFELPSSAKPADVQITFYPERVMYGQVAEVEPLLRVIPKAALIHDGLVQLGERASVFADQHPSSIRDIVVAVEVNGSEVYRNKAKYQEAEALGFGQRGDGCWFIDQIQLNT